MGTEKIRAVFNLVPGKLTHFGTIKIGWCEDAMCFGGVTGKCKQGRSRLLDISGFFISSQLNTTKCATSHFGPTLKPITQDAERKITPTAPLSSE